MIAILIAGVLAYYVGYSWGTGKEKRERIKAYRKKIDSLPKAYKK